MSMNQWLEDFREFHKKMMREENRNIKFDLNEQITEFIRIVFGKTTELTTADEKFKFLSEQKPVIDINKQEELRDFIENYTLKLTESLSVAPPTDKSLLDRLDNLVSTK